jgi:hypothetical protein
MQYLLSVYQPAGDPPPPEVLDPIMERVYAWDQELKDRGLWVFTGRLLPPHTATVVRTRDQETLVTDGPFVEGKEILGGFTVVRVHDLDEALDWAGRFTAITGLAVEVRPFFDEG